jgi:hypothetical protein
MSRCPTANENDYFRYNATALLVAGLPAQKTRYLLNLAQVLLRLQQKSEEEVSAAWRDFEAMARMLAGDGGEFTKLLGCMCDGEPADPGR